MAAAGCAGVQQDVRQRMGQGNTKQIEMARATHPARMILLYTFCAPPPSAPLPNLLHSSLGIISTSSATKVSGLCLRVCSCGQESCGTCFVGRACSQLVIKGVRNIVAWGCHRQIKRVSQTAQSTISRPNTTGSLWLLKSCVKSREIF